MHWNVGNPIPWDHSPKKTHPLNFCTFLRLSSACSATNPSQTKHEGSLVSHNCSARKCPLRSCFAWRTESRTLNHERKAVWEVQMVLSLTPQHSDHSQGACMYRQCWPFLQRRRWHRKKKKEKEKKRPSLQTPKANTQTVVTRRVPNPSFLLLGACCPCKIKAVSLNWCFHAVMHAHSGQLLKCKLKLFDILHPAFVSTCVFWFSGPFYRRAFPALMYSNLLPLINLSQCLTTPSGEVSGSFACIFSCLVPFQSVEFVCTTNDRSVWWIHSAAVQHDAIGSIWFKANWLTF